VIQILYLINQAWLLRPWLHKEKSINHLFGHPWLLAMALITSANAAATTPADPIVLAQQQLAQIAAYQCRIDSRSAQGDRTLMRYSYRKPGYVRMDFSEPHRGAVLIYAPDSGKVRVWPFGIGTLPVLSLSPSNSLVQGPNGHRVDQSDVGTLLRNIRHLQQGGKTTVIGKETLAGQAVLHLSILGAAGASIDGVHRYEVWLEDSHGFPTKVVSYDTDDREMETVMMDALVFNLHFPADFFTP
jgi:outer membrane lipoprotein-sorting protein